MGMGMGGAITAVAAITMVGTAATTMVGGIIAIGGEPTERARLRRLAACRRNGGSIQKGCQSPGRPAGSLALTRRQCTALQPR